MNVKRIDRAWRAWGVVLHRNETGWWFLIEHGLVMHRIGRWE